MIVLRKPIARTTARDFKHYRRQLVIVLIPGNNKRDELIGFRLKGTRDLMVARVADLYTMAALWHGQKLATAKRQARRDGIPWRTAKKQFARDHKIST